MPTVGCPGLSGDKRNESTDSMWKESAIKSGTPSKHQNEDQNSSRRRRTRKSGNAKSHRSSSRSTGTTRGAKSENPRDGGTLHFATDLDLHLPQSADDDTISKELKTLFYYVGQHVNTYYMNDFDEIVPEHLLVHLRYLHSPFPSFTVDEVLEDTLYPQAVIEHCLNHMLLSSISTNFGSQQASNSNAYELPRYPLLPAAFTAIPQASARPSTVPRNEKHDLQALSRLRVLCSFLVPDIASSEEYQKQKGEMIDRAISDFSEAVSPWEKPEPSPGARRINLKVIFEKAANTGILLFRQPSVFRFVWTPDGVLNSDTQVTLSPALFKITDENGTTLSLPQKMIDIKSCHINQWEIDMKLSGLTLSAIPAVGAMDDSGKPKPG
ncbi:hypothetical protein GJ744_011087 [Endocarpon pusillum]|uniref:Uncharacterized protein n=1 Tax=Endocarpon pusillum TaxID=364733 RepID=A0A8H7AH10_9EURO|nr:hypothetical protein GJ744_011087 [Endocarpon pusillum]